MSCVCVVLSATFVPHFLRQLNKISCPLTPVSSTHMHICHIDVPCSSGNSSAVTNITLKYHGSCVVSDDGNLFIVNLRAYGLW